MIHDIVLLLYNCIPLRINTNNDTKISKLHFEIIITEWAFERHKIFKNGGDGATYILLR